MTLYYYSPLTKEESEVSRLEQKGHQCFSLLKFRKKSAYIGSEPRELSKGHLISQRFPFSFSPLWNGVKKVKLSLLQAVEAHRVVKMSRVLHLLDRQLTDGCEVASLMHQPPFTPRRILALIRGRVKPRAIVWPGGLGQLKNLMTSSGIKPARPSSL
jgi:hypothetical protein